MGEFLGATRARLGVILSASNRMVEPQLRHFAPDGLGVYVTRMRMSQRYLKSLPDMKDAVLRAAELLSDAKVDLIVFQATGVAMDKGPAVEAEVIRAMKETTGIESLSASQAMVEALKALKLKKVVIVSPFDEATNAKEKAYLEAQGFQVVHDIGLSQEAGEDSINLPPARWVELIKKEARPEADGYFLSGSNTTMFEAVAPLEKALGRPAVNSTQATLWAAVRRLSAKIGPVRYPAGAGMLFTSP
jgi:maleate isomerase